MKIEISHISKTFKQGEQNLEILRDLSLHLAAGEVVAVVGESGSGKSTLLSLLAGFETPDLGQMRQDGEVTNAWSEARWAQFRKQDLGFIFQNYSLIPYLTALENVALPLRLLKKSQSAERAQQILQELGLGHRLSHLPYQLSGGESQRVAIARALIHQPGLVLADEPTGSLDAKTGESVLNLLFTELQARSQTALIVTHSHDVASRCQRILTLRQGCLWPS